MINVHDILETIQMIDNENLDVRTITMGISLLDCCDPDIDAACEKIYDKITRYAKDLVKVGEDIEKEYGIPIIHKRISVTPIAMIAAACRKGSGQIRPDAGKGGEGGGGQLHRRIFGAGTKGLRPGGLRVAAEHPGSPQRYRARVLIGEHRLHQGRYQHGCGGSDGPSREGDGGNHR